MTKTVIEVRVLDLDAFIRKALDVASRADKAGIIGGDQLTRLQIMAKDLLTNPTKEVQE